MTWLPAPIAYSISVAVGDRDMIAVGRDLTCTTPLAVVMVAGKDPLSVVAAPEADVMDELELPQATADRTRAAAAARAARR